MVTTKYNFKQWLRRNYPEVKATPVYGLPAYTLDKPLKPIHMFEYNIQTLTNGQHVVFVGVSPEAIPQLLEKAKTAGTTRPGRPRQTFMPTTFASFEDWIHRHEYQYLHRTFIQGQSPNEILFQQNKDPAWNRKATWYLYEFEHGFKDDDINPVVPMLHTSSNTWCVLIRASNSSYVSRKQRFLHKFELMQPILEQLLVTCASAQDNNDWSKAKALAEQYLHIQFDEAVGTVDLVQLKEAFKNGTLTNWLRCRSSLRGTVTERNGTELSNADVREPFDSEAFDDESDGDEPGNDAFDMEAGNEVLD